MAELFESFPELSGEKILIRKMQEKDVTALMEITENENVYRYIPPFLYKKSKTTLLTAIRNLGGRDFEKKKMIIAGIYSAKTPDRLIGLAEIEIAILKAFVMPENIYSSKALIKNGFIKESILVTGENWGGREKAELEEYTLNA